jgi:hypothetical protein
MASTIPERVRGLDPFPFMLMLLIMSMKGNKTPAETRSAGASIFNYEVAVRAWS